MSIGTEINNPFDIEEAGIPWLGLIGVRDKFCMFDTLEHGLRAGFRDLHTAWKIDGRSNIDAIAMKYAPPNENDTEAYIQGLVRATNWGRYDTLNLDDAGNLRLLGRGVLAQEQGSDYVNQLDGALIDQAVSDALG